MDRFRIELEFSVESYGDAYALYDQIRTDFQNSEAYRASHYNTSGSHIKLEPVEKPDKVIII